MVVPAGHQYRDVCDDALNEGALLKTDNTYRRLQIALALCAACVVIPSYGCSTKAEQTPAIAEKDAIVRIVEKVFDEEWKTAGTIIVDREGVYSRTFQNLWDSNAANETVTGKLPDRIMKELRQDISDNSKIEVVDGIPTYEYGIDDHHVGHPPGISALLKFLAGRNA